MDDLTGLDWSASTSSAAKKPPPMNSSPAFYPALRPTPSPLTSGRNTPLSAQGSGTAAFKPPIQKPAQDSFSNLVSFGSGPKSNANLSLREQQERLEAEKQKKEEDRRKQAQAQYGNGQFWDTLGQRSTGNSRTASPAIPPPTTGAIGFSNGNRSSSNDDDLFSAFNASTKVDNASHYPPPSSSERASPANAAPLNLNNPVAWKQSEVTSGGDLGDDDDPFGLSQLKQTSRPTQSASLADDSDVLGDLGRPVDEVKRTKPTPVPARRQEPEPGKAIEDSSSDSDDDAPPATNDPFDKAVAQLMDYGFTRENAARGLTESGAGLNVQAAVNWLLDDAHRQSKEKTSGKNGIQSRTQQRNERESRDGSSGRTGEDSSFDGPSRRDNRSPALGDGDLAKTAAAVGNNLLKTANSLWKTGQKKVQRAVADFQQDADPSQPKWMKSAGSDRMDSGENGRSDVTNEAAMLESGSRSGRSQGRLGPEEQRATRISAREQLQADSGTRPSRPNGAPKWQQSANASMLDARTRLSKQSIEEQSSQVYVSPARRKKASPQPPPQAEADLIFGSSAAPKSEPALPQRPAQSSRAAGPVQTPASRTSPSDPRLAPAVRPVRRIPTLSAVALQTSTQHRNEGTAHFKRGDYAAAHLSYSNSLSAVPQTHPLAIVLLCNRALTALKTGEPRQAVADADTALGLIGEGKGEGESVDLDGSEKRSMKELYGKALTRKAEALEQMEKWVDAGTVWQLCVESGVGGPTAIAGRQRCQKALAPKPPVARASPSPRPAAAPKARPRPATSQKSSEAVQRLREANKAAEREGDEKFALVDKVDARIAAWREGKRENLRALLASLDNVLWDGSGWKKVGLHELVMANKVKIVYMKAIAKTHPDKISQDANTEVRMIAGIVFSTLNEAWDKFKAENGL